MRLQEMPVDDAGQLHQRVAQTDNLIQPWAEQIRLSHLAKLFGTHRTASIAATTTMESRFARMAIRQKTNILTPEAGERKSVKAGQW
jgi:hypothetical protein